MSDERAANLSVTHYHAETVGTYTIQVIGPQALFISPELLRETEENLTDLLPEGYSVRIMEWDAKEDDSE